MLLLLLQAERATLRPQRVKGNRATRHVAACYCLIAAKIKLAIGRSCRCVASLPRHQQQQQQLHLQLQLQLELQMINHLIAQRAHKMEIERGQDMTRGCSCCSCYCIRCCRCRCCCRVIGLWGDRPHNKLGWWLLPTHCPMRITRIGVDIEINAWQIDTIAVWVNWKSFTPSCSRCCCCWWWRCCCHFILLFPQRQCSNSSSNISSVLAARKWNKSPTGSRNSNSIWRHAIALTSQRQQQHQLSDNNNDDDDDNNVAPPCMRV